MNKIILMFIVAFTSQVFAKSIEKSHFLIGYKQSLSGIIIDNYNFDERFSEKMMVVNSDSLSGRIENIWNKGNQYYVKVALKNYDEEIKLSVFNMLGREVLLIYNNKAMPKDFEYTFDGNLLPNGIYICILEGKSFRDAEKFVVSR